MKVLSLIEPWASLMALGVKRNETRSWSTNYRGDLAIAASNRKTAPVFARCSHEMLDACFSALVEGYSIPDGVYSADYLDEHTIGRILCVVRLAQMVPTEKVFVGHPESLFGDYTPGRWAWVTTDCRRLPHPIRFRGSQGIRDLDPGLVGAIRRQL